MNRTEESLRMRLLGKWGAWASVHWAKALLLALVLTAIMAVGMSMVEAEFTFYSIMPEGSPQVRDMKRIIENFPVASSIIVVLEAKEKSDRIQAEHTVTKAVDAICEELSNPAYSKYIARVQGHIDVEFYKEHGLMVTEAEDIRRANRIYSDLNLVPFFTHLNDDFEREYSGDEEKLSDDEEMVIAQFTGLEKLLTLVERAASGSEVSKSEISTALDEFLFGESYYLNRDSTMALALVQPTFTVNDLEPLMTGVPLIDRAVQDMADDLGVKAGLTGLTVVGKDEGVTAEKGLALSMLIAVSLILLLMILTYRMYSVPFITGIPLIVGILWTIGMTGFVLRRLNIMTAMYMVALLGLGIDYAIHLLMTFVQERDDGVVFVEAVRNSFRKSGSGVFLGALTTAVAFFMLFIAQSEVVKELGLVAGFGILCELAAMLIMIPALLGLRNSWLEKRGRRETFLLPRLLPKAHIIPTLGAKIVKHPSIFIIAMLAFSVGLATQSGKVTLIDNLMEMEAEGLESVELQDRMVEEFGMAPDYLMVRSSDLQELRGLEKRLKKLSSIKRVESLIPYYPSQAETAERGALADTLRFVVGASEPLKTADVEALKEEIIRVEANLIEMSDLAFMAGLDRMEYKLNYLTGMNQEGEKVRESSIDRLIERLDSDSVSTEGLVRFQQLFVPLLKAKILRMASSEPVSLEMIPPIVRESYVSKNGQDYIMSLIPTQNPWEGDFREVYIQQISTYTDRATGMILAADQMNEMAETDGIRAAVASLLAIFMLLLLDFRNLKLSVATLLPLLLSFGSLFGIMAATGIKFDFVNIISVPLLIGIGIDDAVHINHRYLIEGKGKMARVISKTGVAVLMTTVTTIIGFASFIPSVMRAMQSTGVVLSVAMALAFLFSVFFHPAFLVIISEKLGWNIKGWGRNAASRMKGHYPKAKSSESCKP
jgi:predicted RND superfamily exporter protein